MSPPPSDASDSEQATATETSTATGSRESTAVDEYLPDAGVDSRWWYWIATVPVYVALSTLIGMLFFVVAFLGMFMRVGGPELIVLALVFVVLAVIPGVLLSVLFPLALYVDAKAVASADLDWDPDPALYGLVGVASVLMTAFTVSAVVALYYLYQRHKHVGTP